ncbi:MAG: plasmid pRiA4b ORF-3 family protein [Gammaproteobacteria bacterium]|nr:plasmid pRiA4b ORF-3 family protein [Gammaproteobacteria bacterium]
MSLQSNIVHLRQTYQIKVVLSHISPPIWRRVAIDSRVQLSDLHDVIQVAMGWTDSHMHQFIDRNGVMYTEPFDSEFTPSLDQKNINESEVLLNEVLKSEKDWIKYEYDFGDGWEHKIILEKILPHQKNQFPMVCIKGKRACPPEDCGGPWGYQHLLEQLASPEDEDEYIELMEWLGGDFDPEFFELKEINRVLEELFQGEVFNNKGGLEKELKRIESEHNLSADEMGLDGLGLEGMSLKDLGMDFSDSERFDELGQNFSAFSHPDLDDATRKLMNDPDLPPEIKQLLGGMMEAIEVVHFMSGLIDQSIESFEKITNISNDKKVTAIAKKMLKILEDES